MKMFLFKTFAIFIFIMQSFSNAGNEGGHGGDPYAIEFSTIGNFISKSLIQYEIKNPQIFRKWNFTSTNFKEAVASIRITSSEGPEVILRGQEVDAINFPDKSLILVNRTRWRESSLHSRVQLVLHEYFGILDVERDHFQASIDFAAFSIEVTKTISSKNSSESFIANIYYGQCISVPALISSSTCETSSTSFYQAKKCALAQAEGKCRLSGKAQCQLLSLIPTAKVSKEPVGLRYCEILAIMK